VGYSRRGLIGMGVAGGLVPSPSATIVLVASLGLGRTVFGLVLVVAYGVGMAATLTAVGLLLVRVRHRLDSAASSERLVARLGRRVQSLTAVLPIGTAVLVLLVGVGLAVRGLLTPY
jgi:nickel/cobalt exporter